MSSRSRCIRCGECCIRSSPTLQEEDLPLLREGPLERRHLYTIRRGELVRDPIRDALTVTGREMIKVREGRGETGGCLFYDHGERACRIYDRRPAQCAALRCWDPREFMEVWGRPKAERRDIVEDGVLLGLMEEHEVRCSYAALENRVREIPSRGAEAVDGILDLLRYDYRMRPFLAGRLGIDPAEMDFLFGRPLIETVAMFGLQVIRREDGSFFLTTAEPPMAR
ncbi:MAG: YkgJ family cysteine cluster protein [Deltaproteobacteria bacterium]|nr:YkgJ family cysteine cluster protein [Deltaproteobacteria bacterium]